MEGGLVNGSWGCCLYVKYEYIQLFAIASLWQEVPILEKLHLVLQEASEAAIKNPAIVSVGEGGHVLPVWAWEAAMCSLYV